MPGAASNQPPVPATAPVNGASAPLQGAGAGAAGGAARRDATTNYELDRTVQMKRNAVGVAFRVIPYEVVPFEQLGLPKIVEDFAEYPRGRKAVLPFIW